LEVLAHAYKNLAIANRRAQAKHASNSGLKSIKYKGPNLWNELPSHIKYCNYPLHLYKHVYFSHGE